jgi:hypothetical protein
MWKKLRNTVIGIGILFTLLSTQVAPLVTAAPGDPTDPYPASGSTGVSIFVDLSWVDGQQTSNSTYNVFLGLSNPPQLVSQNQTETTFDPVNLARATTYFWQVIIYDHEGGIFDGPVWSFSTASNHPPFQPVILDAPSDIGPEIPLNFSAVASDPEGDTMYYQWDWGDGNISQWLGPHAFFEHATTRYQWMQNGEYTIKVRAKDAFGSEGPWSAIHQINVARQLEIVNLKPGNVYFNFFGFDNSWGYVYSLDYLGMALIISTGGFTVNASASDAVSRVDFEMANLFMKSQRWTATDENETGVYQGYFALTPGLYQVTASAYDSHGALIDRFTRDYVLYYQVKFTVLKALLSKITGGRLGNGK